MVAHLQPPSTPQSAISTSPTAATTPSASPTTSPHTNRRTTAAAATSPTSSSSAAPSFRLPAVLPSPPPRVQRCVVVTGVRTPFVKSFTSLRTTPALNLAATAVSALLTATALPPSYIDQLVLGNVVVSTASPNIAREVVLDLHLPPTIPGTTVSVACLSGLEAVAIGVAAVERGDAECVVAGGVDSTSNAEMPLPQHVTSALGVYQMGGGNKRGWQGWRELLSGLGMPWTWLPSAPTVSERSTGRTMGYHADLMAEINGITREEQDAWSVRSHQLAAKARKDGKMDQEVYPVTTTDNRHITRDSLIRESIDIGKLASLPPAFRPPPTGTVTAASSSALTDGASACLLMSASLAASMGYASDVSVVTYVKSAIDPFPQLLLAPAIAIPIALHRARLRLADIDLFEFHEAFAGQVLATLACLDSVEFYSKVGLLVEGGKVGKVDRDRVNVNGGSIAIGHPFGATGGRLVTSLCAEMRRRASRYGLISICAAGGIGGVMILERRDEWEEDARAPGAARREESAKT